MNAFTPRTVLALVLFGALTFLALLWFIGQGDTGPGPANGGAHARGHGLTGYAGLAELLERQGIEVTLSRSPARLTDEALLVLTPPAGADPAKIAEIIRGRRYAGPTLLILPKWYALSVPDGVAGSRPGWVQLLGADEPEWTRGLDDELTMRPRLAALGSGGAQWQGLGMSGALPQRRAVLGLNSGPFIALVRDSRGRQLVGYVDDHGCYPVLERAAGSPSPDPVDCDGDKWNLTVAFEPDLLNNYGMADRNRAMLAAQLVELAREGQDVPVVFDLTLNGYGAARNLLTLAFAPPFLAATLSLLLALAMVGWRAFGRFGSPLTEARTIAFGKAQLAANAGGLIRRSGRLHLLGAPYAALIARRLAHALGLRRPEPEAIDAAIARRASGAPTFSQLASRLESARGPSQTLRAAHALKSLERTLEQ